MNEQESITEETNEFSQSEDKARLWKKKQSIVEPTSVYDNEEREDTIPKERLREDTTCEKGDVVETKPSENTPTTRLSRETFKQRAQQRQREIDQMKMMLLTHQSRSCNDNHAIVDRQIENNNKAIRSPVAEPFDFQRIEKQHEIDSRFSQFCHTHNKLTRKQPTGLLRASMLQMEENTKRRIQPSCKSRRLQSESGSLSLISKTPQQLERILSSLDEQCIQQVRDNSDATTTPKDGNHSVEIPIAQKDNFFFRPPSSSFPISHPFQIDFDEEAADYKKSYKVIKTGSSTILFSQRKSVFSKNNK